MKIRQFIPVVVSILIAVLFLFTSTGFNVYIHHCSAASQSEYAVLTDDFLCNHADACQDHDEAAHKAASASSENNHIQEGKCCTTVSRFMKIQDSYHQSPVINLTAYPLYVELNLLDTTNAFMLENLSPADFYYAPPPLLTGFDRLLFISQLKIPAFS